MRSMRLETSDRASSLMSMRCFLDAMPLERRNSPGCRGILDGPCETEADEHALIRRVEKAGHDAHHLAVRRHQRAARVSAIDCGIELDEIGEQTFALRRAVLAPETGNHARRHRRPDAERKANGDDPVPQREVMRG